MIDQHAADERVQLEKIQSNLYGIDDLMKFQNLDVPLQFSFKSHFVRTISENIQMFLALGLNITKVSFIMQ